MQTLKPNPLTLLHVMVRPSVRVTRPVQPNPLALLHVMAVPGKIRK